MTGTETPTTVPVPVVVRRGHPTPEELAALVAALTVVARHTAAQQEAAPVPVSRWGTRVGLRSPMAYGPGAWQAGLR